MEIIAATIGSFVEKSCSVLFDATGHQIGYLLHYSDNIEALRKQVKKLQDTRGDIQLKVDAAIRNNEVILVDVQNWITKAENVSREVEKLLEDAGKAKKRCFKGCCIDLISRYRFSKAVKQKIAAITKLQEDGKFKTLSQPAPSPPIIISTSVELSETSESKESIKKEIMEALKDDKVSIIGIYGIEDVGKSTLVKEVGKQAKEENLYDSVVMVVVSQTASIMNIQKTIAGMLGLTWFFNYPKSVRACSLWKRIKKEKRILIILEDIQERIKLEEIGIPFGKHHGGCKIVLTSPSKNVCDEMACDKKFAVEKLIRI